MEVGTNAHEMARRIMECASSGDQAQLDHLLRTEVSPDLLKTVVDQLRGAGNNAFKKGNYAEAYNYYTEALSGCRDDPETMALLYSNASAAQLAMNNHAEAAKFASKAIEARPDWAKGWFRASKVLQDQKRYSEALKLASIALAKEPQSEALQKYESDLQKLAQKERAIARVTTDYTRFSHIGDDEDDEQDCTSTTTGLSAGIEFAEDLPVPERLRLEALLTGQPLPPDAASTTSSGNKELQWDPSFAWTLHTDSTKAKEYLGKLHRPAVEVLLRVLAVTSEATAPCRVVARACSVEGQRFTAQYARRLHSLDLSAVKNAVFLGSGMGTLLSSTIASGVLGKEVTVLVGTGHSSPLFHWVLESALAANNISAESLQIVTAPLQELSPMYGKLLDHSQADGTTTLVAIDLEHLQPTGPSFQLLHLVKELWQSNSALKGVSLFVPQRLRVSAHLALLSTGKAVLSARGARVLSSTLWSTNLKYYPTRCPRSDYKRVSADVELRVFDWKDISTLQWIFENKYVVCALEDKLGQPEEAFNAIVVTAQADCGSNNWLDVPGCAAQFLDQLVNYQEERAVGCCIAARWCGSSLAVRYLPRTGNGKPPPNPCRQRSSRLPQWLLQQLSGEEAVSKAWTAACGREVLKGFSKSVARMDRVTTASCELTESAQQYQVLIQEGSGGILAAAALAACKPIFEARGLRPTVQLQVRDHESSAAAAVFAKALLAADVDDLVETERSTVGSAIVWNSFCSNPSANTSSSAATASAELLSQKKAKLRSRVAVHHLHPQEVRPPAQEERDAKLIHLAAFCRAPRAANGMPILPAGKRRLERLVNLAVSQQVDVGLIGDGILPTLSVFRHVMMAANCTSNVLPVKGRIIGLPVAIDVNFSGAVALLSGEGPCSEGLYRNYFAVDPNVLPMQPLAAHSLCLFEFDFRCDYPAAAEVTLQFKVCSATSCPTMTARSLPHSGLFEVNGFLAWCDIILCEKTATEAAIGVSSKPDGMPSLASDPWAADVMFAKWRHPQCALQLVPPLLFKVNEDGFLTASRTQTSFAVQWKTECITDYELRLQDHLGSITQNRERIQTLRSFEAKYSEVMNTFESIMRGGSTTSGAAAANPLTAKKTLLTIASCPALFQKFAPFDNDVASSFADEAVF